MPLVGGAVVRTGGVVVVGGGGGGTIPGGGTINLWVIEEGGPVAPDGPASTKNTPATTAHAAALAMRVRRRLVDDVPAMSAISTSSSEQVPRNPSSSTRCAARQATQLRAKGAVGHPNTPPFVASSSAVSSDV
jgi:hypothetical protein